MAIVAGTIARSAMIVENQTAEYSGIEMSVNRQGMLRVRVLDDDGGFTTQDIVEIRSCPLCGKRFVKG